jgi:prolyl-tRNA editing enzyme YbaK/EbsC (Cys-tRNA(Pro) deacylase)
MAKNLVLDETNGPVVIVCPGFMGLSLSLLAKWMIDMVAE